MLKLTKVLQLINKIKEKGIIKDYAIGGGYALNYYIEPTLTYDLDLFILIDTDQGFHDLYNHIRDQKYRIENVYIVIEELPVQFLPSYIKPFIKEGISNAKEITIENTKTKVLTLEYTIVNLLWSFRPKDRMILPDLIGMADRKLLCNIIERYSDEETPLCERFKKILENI